jgi:hypothetical protein
MELSAEVLQTTVSSVKTYPGERRQHQRLPFRFRVKITPYENEICSAPISVWTRDISPGGIGLVHREPMREGRKFIMKLPRQDGTLLLLLCTVRNCVRLAAGVYGIGATFAEVGEASCVEPNRNSFPPALVMQTIPLERALLDEIRRVSEAILA